eukprot:CAMPEP_0168598426 /NCGR_PEP_ID=MMETSP0420-20121227/11390_1 /TAXON_ID=498008 /ORGANISM="Pessonella sp." /LENGTH=68 /DNA_ID=CAMNT_0008635741 /DNA_START=121 /DNA_END=323 /DNA_ORIENTATION=+
MNGNRNITGTIENNKPALPKNPPCRLNQPMTPGSCGVDSFDFDDFGLETIGSGSLSDTSSLLVFVGVA